MKVGLGPVHTVLDGDPATLPQKRGTAPNFLPMSVVAKRLNGSRCHLVRWPRPGQHCVRCGPSSTSQGAQPQFSAHVCCGQTPGWIKMPLGTKVGLGPGHIVLHGTQLPLKRGTAAQFSAHVYCGQTVAHLSCCSALVMPYVYRISSFGNLRSSRLYDLQLSLLSSIRATVSYFRLFC